MYYSSICLDWAKSQEISVKTGGVPTDISTGYLERLCARARACVCVCVKTTPLQLRLAPWIRKGIGGKDARIQNLSTRRQMRDQRWCWPAHLTLGDNIQGQEGGRTPKPVRVWCQVERTPSLPEFENLFSVTPHCTTEIPEKRGCTFLRKFSKFLPNYTASHLRRRKPSLHGISRFLC
jgi:hypothetical protein